MGAWLAQELKRLRLARGMSLRQMATRSGLPHMTYTTYELAKAVPPVAKRPPMAEALGLTERELDDLIEDDAYEVFLRSRQLSEAGRAAAREFLRKVRNEDWEAGVQRRPSTPLRKPRTPAGKAKSARPRR